MTYMDERKKHLKDQTKIQTFSMSLLSHSPPTCLQSISLYYSMYDIWSSIPDH